MRDGMSLLDQAIAVGSGEKVTEAQIRDMLGLADRSRVIDLFELVMSGNAGAALDELREQFDIGADPAVVLADLLEFTHWLTRLKVAASAAKDTSASESDVRRGEEMATKLPLSVLTRTWQMLLKGLEEVRRAPQPISAAEMVLIRLVFVADLPAPADLVKKITSSQTQAPSPSRVSTAPTPPGPTVNERELQSGRAPSPSLDERQSGSSSPSMAAPDLAPQVDKGVQIATFESLTAKAEEHRAIRLKVQLEDHVHVVSFTHGRIDLRLSDNADRDLIKQLQAHLKEWTGDNWFISLSDEKGAPTIRSLELKQRADRMAEVKKDPLVSKAFELFPGAEIVSVQDLTEDVSLDAVVEDGEDPSD